MRSKLLAILLVVVIVIGLLAVPAMATEKTSATTVQEIPTLRWGNGYQTTDFPCVSYRTATNETITIGGTGLTVRTMKDGTYVYCIQPSYLVSSDAYYPDSDAGAWTDWLTPQQQKAIGVALTYGYPAVDYGYGDLACTSYKYDNSGKSQMYAATQIIIWEIISGLRSAEAPYAAIKTDLYDAVYGWEAFEDTYVKISNAMADAGNVKAEVVVWDDGAEDPHKGQALVSLATPGSTNNSANKENSGNSNVSGSGSGNHISDLNGAGSGTSNNNTILNNGTEDNDALDAYNIEYGSACITVSSDDGALAGFSFRLRHNTYKYEYVITTDETGSAVMNHIPAGNYTATAIGYAGYYPVKRSVSFTVHENVVDTVSFDFELSAVPFIIENESEDCADIGYNVCGKTITGKDYNKYFYTNSKGVATVTDLLPGTYVVTEFKNADDHATATKEVTIAPGESEHCVYFGVDDETSQISFIRTAEDYQVNTSKYTVSDGKKFNETKYANDKGVAIFSDLKPGVYTVTEENPSYYTITSKTWVVDVSEGGQSVMLESNGRLSRGTLCVVIDANIGDVSGVKLQLSGKAANGDTVLTTKTTNSYGMALFINMQLSNNDGYQLVEINPSDEYYAPAAQKIDIKDNQIAVAVVEHESKTPVGGSDDSDDEDKPHDSNKPDDSDEPDNSGSGNAGNSGNGQGTTPGGSQGDSNNKPSQGDNSGSQNNKPGTDDEDDKDDKDESDNKNESDNKDESDSKPSTDKEDADKPGSDSKDDEDKKPSDDKVDDGKEDSNKDDSDDEDQKDDNQNDKEDETPEEVYVDVSLKVLDRLDLFGVKGVTLTLYNKRNQKIADADTDRKGTALFEDLEPGDYSIVMTEPADGYVLTEEPCEFTIDEDGEVTGLEDMLILPTNIIITIVDEETDAPVKGAVVTVYDSNNSKYTEEITDENGQVVLPYLEQGTYKYVVSDVPEGNTVNEESVPFKIDDEGNPVASDNAQISLEQATSVTITVLDKDTDEPVPGARFIVYDENGDKAFEGETNAKGDLNITSLKAGKYTYEQIDAPKNYDFDSDVYTFTITDDGEGKGYLTIYNTCKVTEIEISVKDNSSKTGLEGAKITVYDKDNKEIFSGKTDKNGIVKIEELDEGEYAFVETEAPEGYVRSRQTYTFTVEEDGSVIGDLTVYNKKEGNTTATTTVTTTTGGSSSNSGLSGNPKTGNVDWGSVFLFVAFLCAAGLAGTGVWMYKSRKKES